MLLDLSFPKNHFFVAICKKKSNQHSAAVVNLHILYVVATLRFFFFVLIFFFPPCDVLRDVIAKECNRRHPGFSYQLVSERWGIPHMYFDTQTPLIRMFSARSRGLRLLGSGGKAMQMR